MLTERFGDYAYQVKETTLAKSLIKPSLLLLLFFFVGCSHNVKRYHPSPDLAIDLENMYSKYNKKIKIGSIRGSYLLDPLCRMSYSISPPQTKNEHLCSYIKDAFIIELKRAGLYSSDSKIEITIALEDMDFNSITGFGKWKYSVTLISEKVEWFTVSSVYEFNTNWYGYMACQQVADAFPGSVEKLIKDITNDPKFIEFFK